MTLGWLRQSRRHQKYIILAKKLKAMAERGESGERYNAQRQLDRIMQKHGITKEELDDALQSITLFSNREELLYAKAEKKHWVVLNRLPMAQAYIMPVPMVEDFLLFAKQHIKPEIYFDNNRLSLWALKRNIKIWATAPSLVEHIGWSETTLRGGYKEGHRFSPEQRMSRWFIGLAMSLLWVS